MSDTNTIHVIGGGLAGLATAATIARAGCPVVVHEQRGRLGGRATTDERDGFRFNQGPHALYLGGEAVPVLGRLGIGLATLPGAPGITGSNRMVLGGEDHAMPMGARTLMTTGLLGARDKVEVGRVLARVGSIDAAGLAGTTVREWVDGAVMRPRARAVVEATLRLASYTHAPDVLSAQVAVMQLQRSLAAGVRYLDGGWQTLVDRLAATVVSAGGQIVPGSVVTELPDAAAVVIATGGPAVAERLTGAAFSTGPASEAAVLDLALSAPPAHRFVVGVDEPRYLSDHGFMGAMTPAGRWSVSLAQYLAPAGEQAEPDRAALRAFARHAGIADADVIDERYLHRMTTVTAIATAEHGGLRGRPAVAVPDRPGVFVAGDWVGGRGYLADAVLASAEEAALAAVAHVERSVHV